jgi:hypothetical protein
MKRHDALDDQLRDLAVEFVLKHPADPADEYARHLEGCEVCNAEVETLRVEIAALGFLAPERAPRSDLLSRLVVAQPWKEWDAPRRPAASTFVGREDSDWQPTAFPGVFVRRLFVDHDRDRVTMVVRMEPGSSYPGHAHGGHEECYVLSGDLKIGPLHMKAGDFQRSERGSDHPLQETGGGCELLISSSLHDRLHDQR